ncbi:MAG: NusG domain II-containing protein [Clostridia bacterium]|nr:NusG domain II-containing protein [Clostridia bacterium]
MAVKKIEQIKEGKFFRIWDLVAYGVIVAVTVALFLGIFLSRDASPTDGIKISYNGEVVFTYEYASDEYKIFSDSNIDEESIVDTDESLTLVFYTQGKRGYNKIVIDKLKKSVKVVDADCSTHKDCVYTPALADNSSIISCPPHSMLIEPLVRTFDDDGNIIIG